jgi:hypothetical protein
MADLRADITAARHADLSDRRAVIVAADFAALVAFED